MAETNYAKDHRFRIDLESLMEEHGYHLEAFALADKPSDDVRIVTIKAERSLTYEQRRIFPVEGAG
jgi:hypothetical protein